jgi:predicted amidohydrolase
VDDALLLASKIDAKLIVLPELFNTGYLFRDMGEAFKYAEDPVNGYTARRLANFTKDRDKKFWLPV